MTANAKFGWRVGVSTVVVAGIILAASTVRVEQRHPVELRLDRTRLSESERSLGNGDRIDQLHAAGIQSLRAGAAGEAVRLLGTVVQLTENDPIGAARKAELLNDLAAAHHELAHRGPAKNLIIGLDAAQKAWTLERTPVTAWTRAILLDAVAGADVAAEAWNDYLRLDPASVWAGEARRRTTSQVLRALPERRFSPELQLRGWANAVLAGRTHDEVHAVSVLAAEGRANQRLAGDEFLLDVSTWLGSLAEDRRRKTDAARAILLLYGGPDAIDTPSSVLRRIRKAAADLRNLQSPLSMPAVVHLSGHGNALDEVILAHGSSDACAGNRHYLAACAALSWSEGLHEADKGRFSAAFDLLDRAAKACERMGDVASRGRILLFRAATLDAMRAPEEAWADRMAAAQMLRSNAETKDRILTTLAIAAARDGYYYAADGLFAQVQSGSVEQFASWRAFTRSRIEGDTSDPDLYFLRHGVVGIDGTYMQASARFTSARRDTIQISVAGHGAASPARRDWSAPADTFASEAVEREAVGFMMADSVRRLYERESRIEAAKGATEAALWMSDSARIVGRPSKETDSCIGERGAATAEEMGRKLVACVPPGVTLIHQDLDSALLRTWVVRGGRAELTTTWTNAVRVTAEIERFRLALGSNAATRAQAEQLYDLLLRPVQRQIAGMDILVYSPSPMLRGLPVAALHDGTRFLIETRPVVTTPTITAFRLAQPATQDASALVVLPQATRKENELHGARNETGAVARIYDGRTALLTDTAATPEAFLRSALLHEIIHVATHGQTRGAPYQNSIEFGQQRLRAYDIFTLELKRRPVVMLAACRTADSTGSPMNVSLSEAFLAAGASSVVGSLWDVEDRATVRLSVAFHRELARGATPHDALRTVQLQFIRQGMPVSAWAAFQVSS
jgi:CHAT domain-containing protein